LEALTWTEPVRLGQDGTGDQLKSVRRRQAKPGAGDIKHRRIGGARHQRNDLAQAVVRLVGRQIGGWITRVNTAHSVRRRAAKGDQTNRQ
jgi:hypothetical protein